jgi:hypothetical protein
MANISSSPDGRRTVQFVAPDGKRRSVRLGKLPIKTAEEVRRRVEYLAAARRSGVALDNETVDWLGKVGAELHSRLTAVGLVEARASASASTGPPPAGAC